MAAHQAPPSLGFSCFFYIPTISTNKRYENLAASIGSTNETRNQSFSNDFDSLEAPAFLGCFKLPVPLVVGRPQTITCAATNNHMHSYKSLAGRLESHQRGFRIETLLLCPGDLLSKSSKLTFSRKSWWGDSLLLMSEELVKGII